MIRAEHNGCPAPGLASFILRAVGTEGEIINGIGGLNIPSGVHHVTPAFGQPATHIGWWTGPHPNGALDPAWRAYDTHLLFDPADASSVVGFLGFMEESNSGSDPAGLDLMAFGFGATEGLGYYRFDHPTDLLVVTPAVASSNLPFLQVVLPINSSVGMNVTLFDTTGARYDFRGRAVPLLGELEPCVPEPQGGFLAITAIAGLTPFRRLAKARIPA